MNKTFTKILSLAVIFSLFSLTTQTYAVEIVPVDNALTPVTELTEDTTPVTPTEVAPVIMSLIPEFIIDEEIVDEEVGEHAPYFTILPYDAVTPTQSLTLTAQSNQAFTTPSSYTVTENGMYTFIVIDTHGTATIYPVTITNIDRTAPVITVGDYNTASTTGPITVTATTNETATLNETSHTFTTNGSFTFTATDVAGNIAEPVTVTITNIRQPSSGGGSIGSFPRPVPAVGGTLPTTTTPGQVLGAEKYVFTKFMQLWDRNEEVRELQNRLIADGHMTGPSTGYFGLRTLLGVRSFQKANGIKTVGTTIRTTGNVGPLTLAALNK